MPKGVPKDGRWRGLASLDAWVTFMQAEAPLCACGCGERIQIQRHHRSKGVPVFVHGHHARSWVHRDRYHPNWHEDRSEVRDRRNGMNFIPSVRREIWERDGGACLQCGARSDLTFDHIIAVREGGDGSAENCQLLCRRCHNAKSRTERRRRRSGGE